MLNQFFRDWNTAIQSRTVTKETRNPKGVITQQETKFRFRNVEVIMYSRIDPRSENGPENKRRWISELFVPATNKIIPSIRYNTKSRCAAAILTALKEGRDHEDRLEARHQAKRAANYKRVAVERMNMLNGTSFTDEEKKFIVDWLGTHTVDHHFSWDNLAAECLAKYHNYVTGRGLIEIGINLDNEAKWHVSRMYGTIARMLMETYKDKYGHTSLSRFSTSRLFLCPKENISTGIYTLRSGLSKIYDMCKFASPFMHVMELLAAYYEQLTGVSIEDKITEERARRDRARERKLNGDSQPQSRQGKGPKKYARVFVKDTTPIGATIGDMFGDVLEAVKTTDAPAPAKADNRRTYRTSKAVHAVTNGQINGKMQEKPKSVKTEELPPAFLEAEVQLTDAEATSLVGTSVAPDEDKLPDPPAEVEVPVETTADTPSIAEAPAVSVEALANDATETPTAEETVGTPVLPADFKLEATEEAPKKTRKSKSSKSNSDADDELQKKAKRSAKSRRRAELAEMSEEE